MNAKTFAPIGVGILALASGAAMAQGNYGSRPSDDYGLYVGVSAGSSFYNEQGLGSISPTVAQFDVGQQFSPYLAIEGRVGTSVNGDSWYGYHVDEQAIYGGYVKGMWPINPWWSVYGIAGLGGAQIHRNYPHFNTNDLAFSYGVGGELHLGGGASLHLEFSRLTNGDNAGYSYNVNQLLFGVNWRLF